MPTSSRPLIVALVLGLGGIVQSQPVMVADQPCGAGSFRIQVTGAMPVQSLYNLIQTTPFTPTGCGPFFGLGTAGSAVLLPQILAPLGSHPFHVLSDASGEYSFSVGCPTPVGITVPADLVCIQWGPAGYVNHSTVITGSFDL